MYKFPINTEYILFFRSYSLILGLLSFLSSKLVNQFLASSLSTLNSLYFLIIFKNFCLGFFYNFTSIVIFLLFFLLHFCTISFEMFLYTIYALPSTFIHRHHISNSKDDTCIILRHNMYIHLISQQFLKSLRSRDL